MKIIHIITDFSNIYGAQKHTIECINNHLYKGYECKVITGKKGDASKVVEKLGVEVVELIELERTYNLFKDIKLVNKLTKTLKKDNPNLVISHSSKAGIISRIACYIAKIPNIFTVHGWAFEKGTPTIQRSIGWVLEFLVKYISDKYICVSNYTAQFGIKSLLLKKENVFVCAPMHNKLNIANTASNNTYFTVLMVAGFRYQKDHKTALLAIKKIIDTQQDIVKLILVGDGIGKQAIQQLATKLNINKNIEFVGETNDVATYYSNANLVILPTFYEGLPITLLEAAQCAKPIIATNVGGISEIVINNKNGYLINVKDDIALASSIQTIMTNKELALQMQQFSLQHYNNNFANNKCINTLNHIIQQSMATSKFTNK
jgi:glycosyltransferase involved in cell wall biosynthesis